MSNSIRYYEKRLAKAEKKPSDCTDKELLKITKSYELYIAAMSSQEGYVSMVDAICRTIDPYFQEAEKRKLI